jgi:dihydroflavonol-4-reductase
MNVVDGRDVAAAHFAAAERGVPGERYILGGHNTTVPKFFALIARLAGRRTPLTLRLGLVNALFDLSDGLRVPVAETVRTFRYLQHLDSSKAQRELGLTARSLEDTVHDTLDWFRENGYL